MKKKRALIIGCGKFFQTVHLENIKKFYNIEILMDARPKLLENILKNDNSIKRFTDFNSLFSFKKKFDTVFNISSRTSSFKILKKLIPVSKTIFSEKPGVFNINQAIEIKKINSKFKSKILFGYMSRYDKNVMILKNILKEKKIENLKKSNFYISNNNLYPVKKKHFNSLEKKDFSFARANYPKYIKRNHKVNYQIFINRYSHLINLVNFIYPISSVKNFKILDKYNYSASLITKKNKEIITNFSNKGSYIIKAYFEFNDCCITLKLYNPLKKKHSSLLIFNKNKKKRINLKNYTDVFLEEIRSVNNNKNKNCYSRSKELLEDFRVINNLWLKV
tara:strand:+ start:592 stop:1593 length:1002 start_codon:yes stop_codon:yes gene_type:complete